MKTAKKSLNKVITFIVILSLVAIFGIGLLMLSNYLYPKDQFYKGIKINGVDVGGLNIQEASNVLQTNFSSLYDEISITLNYKNKSWTYSGKDFEVVDDFSNIVTEAFNKSTSDNFFERPFIIKQLNQNNNNISISYRTLLGGFDEKINQVTSQIEQPLVEPSINFDASLNDPFTYTDGQNEIIVDKDELYSLIDNAFMQSKNISVYIPYDETFTTTTTDDLKQKTKLLSSFSTSYAKSTINRKNNVRTALNSFNGLIVMPEEEISFNNTTGARTKENGYKPANIILNGVYVEGSGGGVCQASTTLYNALLLANVDITEVHKHSMPASYVPLALDAMVSEGVADLKFKNTMSEPIYIKTYSDDKNVYVNIYGLEFDNGEYFKTRTEFIKAIPHSGDRIVSDVNSEYSSKVTFKGEYLRLKYPQEGYESKAYLQRYSSDGTLLEEKLVRHETYAPQEGIIIEGTEDVYEGITIPENNVKFIPPQTTSSTNKDNIKNKVTGEMGEKYNP